MIYDRKISGPFALVCDPSFAKAFAGDSAPVFPDALALSLSKKFNFEILDRMNTLPVVFIHARSEDVSKMDAYLENAFGDKVSVECEKWIQTDISCAPTLPLK